MMKQMSKINSKFKIQLIKIIPIYRTQILVINVIIHLISGKTFGVTAEQITKNINQHWPDIASDAEPELSSLELQLKK